MKIEIKPLTNEQIEACAILMVENDPWKKVGRTFEQAVENFSSPDHDCYELMVDGKLAGFLVLILNGFLAGGFIKSIMVIDEYQGKGIGKQLLGFAQDRIFEEYSNAYICVSSFNNGALKLYQREGFKVIADLEALLVPEHSEFLLRKTTGPANR